MDVPEIPDDIMKTAEKTLDTLLCNCAEAGDVRRDSIRDIAHALLSERLAQKERDAKIAERMPITSPHFVAAAIRQS